MEMEIWRTIIREAAGNKMILESISKDIEELKKGMKENRERIHVAEAAIDGCITRFEILGKKKKEEERWNEEMARRGNEMKELDEKEKANWEVTCKLEEQVGLLQEEWTRWKGVWEEIVKEKEESEESSETDTVIECEEKREEQEKKKGGKE